MCLDRRAITYGQLNWVLIKQDIASCPNIISVRMMKSIVLVLSLVVTRVRPSTWGYRHGKGKGSDLDPEHWEPEVCQSGKRQSPISIDSSYYQAI